MIVFKLLIVFKFLVPFLQAASLLHSKLPSVLVNLILDYMNNHELAPIRSTSRHDKEIIDEYLRKRLKRRRVRMDILRTWQMTCLLGTSDFSKETIISKLYHPTTCPNHLKLLKFLSIHHLEFLKEFQEIKADRLGFLEPIKSFYTGRGGPLELAEFMKLMDFQTEEKTTWFNLMNYKKFEEEEEVIGLIMGLFKLLKHFEI